MRDSIFPIPFPPEIFYVLGAGRFGHLAVRRLRRIHPEAELTCVDLREDKLIELQQDYGIAISNEDAISFLTRGQPGDSIWIVPAVPIHVAFRWMLAELGQMGRVEPMPVPEALNSEFPNPCRSAGGTVYTSFATFLCPDDCSEPDEICTYTQGTRHANLFDHLGNIEVPGFEVIVIRSWQLAPGVGGYPAGHFKSILKEIFAKAGRYLVATSCRCHGVVDAFEWIAGEPVSG